MAAGTGQRPRGAGRLQLHDVALRLFAQNGVEGTSLQAIADEMGVSKAAVYYHYKTKDELVLGVLAPVVEALDAMVGRIKTRRGRQARLDELLTGVVNLAVDYHEQFAVMLGDPAVGALLTTHALTQGWDELSHLVVDPSDPSTRIALSLFGAGIVGPLRDPELSKLGPEVLREHLTALGRRLLQIRRRPTP
ncbi:TetR/AcrR family transcriptional regulator [Winogradskya humida]|uniref:TetR family transcriptional regulator n=1 Tax=Winogradskya humida TaxID=113566 RepID=A0ABQ4A7F5_9ACTN|nr:TetR/AcrR family transcriptional regulator [Actinoplanes humidus]GIE26802.1 TetR family transcriptional regulator [Actinoplanes humidus]